ncbi:MAG: hypothetical protein HC828_09610 [Blastochloris sp.]|nr:hypothetical protein [Blastochloris sp.]
MSCQQPRYTPAQFQADLEQQAIAVTSLGDVYPPFQQLSGKRWSIEGGRLDQRYQISVFQVSTAQVRVEDTQVIEIATNRPIRQTGSVLRVFQRNGLLVIYHEAGPDLDQLIQSIMGDPIVMQ